MPRSAPLWQDEDMTTPTTPTHRILVLIFTLLISPLIVLLAMGLAELTDVSHKLMMRPVGVMVVAVPLMRAFRLNPATLFIVIPGAVIAGMKGAVKRGGGRYLTLLGLLFFCGTDPVNRCSNG